MQYCQPQPDPRRMEDGHGRQAVPQDMPGSSRSRRGGVYPQPLCAGCRQGAIPKATCGANTRPVQVAQIAVPAATPQYPVHDEDPRSSLHVARQTRNASRRESAASAPPPMFTRIARRTGGNLHCPCETLPGSARAPLTMQSVAPCCSLSTSAFRDRALMRRWNFCDHEAPMEPISVGVGQSLLHVFVLTSSLLYLQDASALDLSRFWPISGSGPVAKESPTVRFRALKLDTDARVTVREGDSHSVEVQGESNVAPHLKRMSSKTEPSSSGIATLQVSNAEVIVTSRRITSIATTGAVAVVAENLNTPTLSLSMGGSSAVL